MVDESLGSTSAASPLLAAPVSESVGHPLDAAGQVAGFRRASRRPTSAGVARTRHGSTLATSRVHQKLQDALQSAETSAATTGCTDLIHAQSLQSSFRARGVASAAAVEKELADRSISRYRADAAIASFANDASPSASFCYSTNFMPGVHFYTFLASKDASKDASGAAVSVAPQGVSSAGPAAPVTAAATALADPNRQSTAMGGHTESSSTSTAKKSTGLRMWIPDTIVYGETGRAIWLYTDEHGVVQRSADVSDKLVAERLVPTNGCDPHPVVVCKEPTTTLSTKQSATNASALAYQGNLLRLLSAGELKTVLSNVSSARSTKSFALQKFIRCNGSKAFIVRAVYDVGKPAYAWMINNTTPMVTPTPTVSQVLLSLGQDAPLVAAATIPTPTTTTTTTMSSRSGSVIGALSSLVEATAGETSTPVASPPPPLQSSVAVPLVNRVCTSVQVDKACTFIKLSERGCVAVAELNQRLVKYIEQRLHLQLQTLVADFVKDADGKWWLLQVKHFRVRHTRASKPYYSLPRRLRMQYLAYRDSSLMEETTESDEEEELERHTAHLAALQAQRQVLKLLQCKCCLAAYPKAELSFKMTLKMISEMLVRVRSRQAPDKASPFLATALARESPDASLAYESWSVCSYCYAIYERDQQLQKVEAKFAEILGMPDARIALAGLGKLDERSKVVDPTATSTVLPVQLTLCRLMLVINGIYDIPPELYDAERDPVEVLTGTCDSSGHPQPLQTVTSRLYLRISALGYTECIPVDPADIMFTQEQAPRGARQRTSSVSSTVNGNGDDDDGDEEEDERDGDGDGDMNNDIDNGNGRRENNRSPRSRLPSRTRVKRNYWLPINLIRTVTFFAPRTPLQAKLKETSGLAPFLNEDNSISIQFIRATEPPLHDLTTTTTMTTTATSSSPSPSSFATTAHVERGRTRRAALQPNRTKPEGVAPPTRQRRHKEPHHSVLLGATKIRMAQFRSAYVTKLDFYACMALRGEMFNVKGNIGLERVRYVDTKLLTSQYRLRAYNGVYIPDASYVPSDPLTAEWMDCLRATINPHSPNGKPEKPSLHRGHTRAPSLAQRSTESMQRSISTTSLGAAGEEMDEELEQMIDLAGGGDCPLSSNPSAGVAKPRKPVPPQPLGNTGPRDVAPEATTPLSKMQKPHAIESLLPTSKTPSRFDSHMAMLLHKPVLSPRANVSAAQPLGDVDTRTGPSQAAPFSGSNRLLWSLTIQLNSAHHLQTRERPFCRWECYYEMLGQRRSAVQRPPKNPEALSLSSTCGSLSSSEHTEVKSPTEITFSCTHRLFLSATQPMLRDHFRAHKTVTLNLRNDVYSSTRSRSTGEFFCQLDVAGLVSATSFDTTLDIHAGAFTPELTPREASTVAHSPPYLSVSLQLSQLASDPNEVISNGSFVVVGATSEDIHVLKKII